MAADLMGPKPMDELRAILAGATTGDGLPLFARAEVPIKSLHNMEKGVFRVVRCLALTRVKHSHRTERRAFEAAFAALSEERPAMGWLLHSEPYACWTPAESGLKFEILLPVWRSCEVGDRLGASYGD